jgi:iron complex transport system substrate-binding protein
MVFEMGLWEHVVGVNDYARLDDTRRAVPRVGDMSPRLEPVLAVDPDLILIQQQSEDFARIAEADQSIRLAHFTIESLDDIPRAAREIGRLMGQEQVGRQAAQTFEDKIRGVRQRTKDLPTVRALFVLGTSRPSVPAEGTFIDDLIRLAGGVNAGRDIPGQGLWRNTRNELIVNARPEVLIVKAQPGKQQEARDWWLGRKEIPAAAAGRVYVVTDDRWVWPVLKQAQFAEALARMLHGLEGDS